MCDIPRKRLLRLVKGIVIILSCCFLQELVSQSKSSTRRLFWSRFLQLSSKVSDTDSKTNPCSTSGRKVRFESRVNVYWGTMSCHDIDQHGIDGQRFFYTRKKDRFSRAPGDYDMIAWRHDRENESSDPILVFRDRLNPDIWITQDEFDRQRREISNANIPVSSQRGSLPVDPAEGRYAWFKVPGHPGRRRHVMDGGRWHCVLRQEMYGV